MNFNGTVDLQNTAKLVRDILTVKMKNELCDLEDNYGIDEELLEGLSMKLFVDQTKKVLWKSSKTKFTKAYEKEVNKLIQDNIATFEDLGLLLYLSTNYTTYEDNYIRGTEGEFLTKKELIEDLHNKTKLNARSSQSYYKKKLSELEKKNLILSEPHPTDKRNKVFYLSPQLFYKGKYMDDKVKQKLIQITKTVHESIKELNQNGTTNVQLDSNFESKSEEEILNEILTYLDEAC